LLPSYASTYLDRWQTLMGLIFIAFVLFAPQGIMALLSRLRRPATRLTPEPAGQAAQPAASPREPQ
jgi:hypothetical protein